jgi:hypothetical protein
VGRGAEVTPRPIFFVVWFCRVNKRLVKFTNSAIIHKTCELYIMDPKQYPANDSSEQNAKTILESLVDSRFVKLDIRTRDKYPNVDGTIEIVNEKSIPIGKFDIQLRSIPEGHTSFSCEVSLTAYGKVSTLPVLLLCVDSEKKCAYWKHINPYMTELKDKEKQQSFTIHFSQGVDNIDQSGIYLKKWLDIANKYQMCIEQYPSLSTGNIQKLSPQTINPVELEIFQKFIDTINNLLDHDFPTFKEIIFPGIWKLGVGIVSSSEHHIQFQIYSIPYKEPAPLVCKLSQGYLFSDLWDKNAICETYSAKDTLLDPQKAGKEFVEKRVESVLKSKLLPVYGYETSSDVLFSFIDRYHPILDVEPNLGSYTVHDLSTALSQRLYRIAESALLENFPVSSRNYNVDLDQLNSYIRTKKTIPKGVFGKPFVFTIGTDRFPISTVNDSLKYLVANGIEEIKRCINKNDLPLPPGASWIWSGYSPENEINRVTYILNHSLVEYKAFVSGNKLKFPNSRYLDSNTTIIFEYEPIKGNKFEDGPGLNEYHIENFSHTLPKLIVYSKDRSLPHLPVSSNIEGQYLVVTYNGKTYKSPSVSYGISHFLFSSTPVLDLVYKMLLDDLSLHYDITINSAFI